MGTRGPRRESWNPAKSPALPPERLTEQEDQRIERLLLRGHRHAPFHRQIAEEGLDVLASRGFEVAGADEIRQAPGPFPVGLFGAPGVVLDAEPLDQPPFPGLGAGIGLAECGQGAVQQLRRGLAMSAALVEEPVQGVFPELRVFGQSAADDIAHISPRAGQGDADSVAAAILQIPAQGQGIDRLHARGQATGMERLAPIGEDDFRGGGEGQAGSRNLRLHDLTFTTCGLIVQTLSGSRFGPRRRPNY